MTNGSKLSCKRARHSPDVAHCGTRISTCLPSRQARIQLHGAVTPQVGGQESQAQLRRDYGGSAVWQLKASRWAAMDTAALPLC